MIGINMKMPKSCDVCDFCDEIEWGNCETENYCSFPRMGEIVDDYIVSRHPNCPLIEIEDKEKIDVD